MGRIRRNPSGYIRPCTCSNTGVRTKRIPKCIRGGFEEYHYQTTFVDKLRQKTAEMEKIRKISKEQVVMAFVATCIETTARQLNTNYNEIYQRMERVGMIENYILPNYEPLHSESREVLAERLIEC